MRSGRDSDLPYIFNCMPKSVMAYVNNYDDLITGDGIQLKMYGKSESRPLRKLGHVNVSKTDSHKDPIMRAECLNVSVRPA